MPKLNEFDLGHIVKLEKIGIRILEQYRGAKKHHDMKCITCGHEYRATPLSKIQNFKLHPDSNGCIRCAISRRDIRLKPIRDDILYLLKLERLKVLTPGYNGKHGSIYEKIRVKNIDCGHEFNLNVGNFLHGNYKTSCTVCGIKKRSDALTKTSIDRHNAWLLTSTGWQDYKYEVQYYTSKNYKLYKDLINPNNLILGISGVDGAHQKDHIISRRYCFDNGIPAEVCGHTDNIRVISWQENIKKGKHIVEGLDIPAIFDEYIESPSIVDWEEPDTDEELSIYQDVSDFVEDSICAEIIELTQKQMLL